MRFTKIIGIFFKKLSGIILCVCALGFLGAGLQEDPSLRAYFIVLSCLSLIGAILLLKKKRKKKLDKNEPNVLGGSSTSAPTEYAPVELTKAEIKRLQKNCTIMQARRDMEILKESFDIACTTTNLDTFRTRYELVMQKAHTILQAEQAGAAGLAQANCGKACTNIIEHVSSIKACYLENYTRSELNQVDNLKTVQEKLNRCVAIKQHLAELPPDFLALDAYAEIIAMMDNHMATLTGNGRTEDDETFADSNIFSHFEPEFPKYPNEDSDIPSDAYLYDNTGHFVGRADGTPLNDADAAFLIRDGYKTARKKLNETMNRTNTQSIVTDEILNVQEQLFFGNFSQELLKNQLNPGYVRLDRLGSEAFNVYYYSCYLGKVYIPEKAENRKYRVIKGGNTRPTRVFNNIEDAKDFIAHRSEYTIQENITETTCWIQYLDGPYGYDVELIESPDLDAIIAIIPHWVKSAKKYMRFRKQI